MSTTFRVTHSNPKSVSRYPCLALKPVIVQVREWMKANSKAVSGSVSFGVEAYLEDVHWQKPWKQISVTRKFTLKDYARATTALDRISAKLASDAQWYDPYIVDGGESPTGMALLVTFHDPALAMLFKLWKPNSIDFL